MKLSPISFALLAVICAAGVLLPATARAIIVAYNITDTSGSASGANITCGFEFTTNTTPLIVTSLGVFDSNQNGLADSHDVGIWDSNGTLLVLATVPSGTAAPLAAQFRYVAVSPTVLAANQSYTIGAFYPDGSDTFVIQASGFATDANISYVQNVSAFGPTIANPFNSHGFSPVIDPSIFGPNFQFTTAIPEPASLSLLGLTTASAALYRWRRKTSPPAT